MPDPVLTAGQIADLSVSTRPEQNPMQIVDISDDLQDYPFAREVLRKGKTKTVTGGKSFTWRVMVNDTGSASHVGLAYEDETSQVDVLTEASADWRHSQVNYSMIKQVLQMNQGDEVKLVDLEMLQEKAALKAWVSLIDSTWFGPPVASTDTTTPWNMATWIVKNSAEGFNGGNPSGYSSIGLNSDDYPNWKNWTAVYTNVTDEDFIRKLHKALTFTDFKPAVDGLPLLNKGPNDYMQFSNYGLIGPLQEYLKASNENLGVDIARYMGSVVINRRPIVRAPNLEADTTNPFYFIRMADVFLYRLKNFWMRRTDLQNLPGRHNVKGTWFDFTWQNVFVSRRGSGVLATGTTYPT